VKSTKYLVFFALLLAGGTSAFSAKIDTVQVQSQCMNKSIPNLVITPDSYATQTNGFAVLYLLHGAGNDYREWLRHAPHFENYADQYNFIIVCPDGGRTSWYFDSPIDSSMKYETYISKELLNWVDEHYRTISHRSQRAIAGLSMGGHGAFYLAFRHQDIWGAAGSMAGGVDIRPFPNNWDIARRLGSYAQYSENWEKNTVINLLHLLDGKDLELIFDCGSSDFFCEANRRLHHLMLERNIPHTYIERPGGHELDYWKLTHKYQLFFFHEFFKRTPATNGTASTAGSPR
jgi:S-formylglutathione hydrolase FrmB